MKPLLTTSRRGNNGFQNTNDAKLNKRSPLSTARLGLLILVIVAMGSLIALPSSSAASADGLRSARAQLASASIALADMAGHTSPGALTQTQAPNFMPLLSAPTPSVEAFMFLPVADTIGTFASNCSTAKSSFDLN